MAVLASSIFGVLCVQPGCTGHILRRVSALTHKEKKTLQQISIQFRFYFQCRTLLSTSLLMLPSKELDASLRTEQAVHQWSRIRAVILTHIVQTGAQTDVVCCLSSHESSVIHSLAVSAMLIFHCNCGK